jgi:hypothetical protein
MTTTPDGHDRRDADHDQDADPPTSDGKQPDRTEAGVEGEPGANPDPDPGTDD